MFFVIHNIFYRLLAVNSGDSGCGLNDNPDPMLMFRDVADLIISRDFLYTRGGRDSEDEFTKTHLEKFASHSDSDKEKFGLTRGTTESPTHSYIISLASTLLLPGTPIIYYGTEIGINSLTYAGTPEKIYPKGKHYNSENELSRSHLPMPWDSTGRRFSATISDTSFTDYLNGYTQLSLVEISVYTYMIL
ncbi:unnamed protein product [Schistosoma turkestanicum]|nr:unnamed protein product [Schistosoma turkestanicum]